MFFRVLLVGFSLFRPGIARAPFVQVEELYTTLNYSRICYSYNIYSGIYRGVNKKESAILGYFDHNILIFVTWILPQLTTRKFFF